jgi:AcrR family transcriptional regulator
VGPTGAGASRAYDHGVSEAPQDPTPTPRRRAERRAELLRTTLALIRREGPRVSMDRIAAESGVTKQIIYRYFGDREGLVREVACCLVAEFSNEMLSATGPGDGPRQRLTATMDAFLAVVERESNLYRFINHYTSVERRDLFGRLLAEQFAAEFERRLSESPVPVEAARPWAYALVGILHFASAWWSGEGDMPRDELVEHLMALVWNGLGNMPAERHD